MSGSRNHPLHLIRSSDQQSSDLLKVDFVKVSTHLTSPVLGCNTLMPFWDK